MAGSLPRRAEHAGRGMVFGIGTLVVVVVAWSGWRFSHPAADQPPPSESELAAKAPVPREPVPSKQQTPDVAVPVPTTVPALMAEAQQVVDGLLQKFPHDPYALDCAAKAHLYLGHTAQASEYWDRCLQLDSQAAFAHEGLGRVAGMKSNYAEAVTHYRKAIELFPSASDTGWLVETTYQLADMLMKLGKPEAAVEVLENNIRRNPESAKSHLLLGQLRLQSREFAEARKSFEEAIRIQPESSQAHFGRATALQRTGEHDKSTQSMKKFQELTARKSKARTRMKFQEEEPKELAAKVAMTYTHVGQIHDQHGDLPGAERHWRRAALLSPANVASRVYLAELYVQSGQKLAEAIRLAQEVVRIDPVAPHYALLSRTYARAGDAAGAWQAAQKAREQGSLGGTDPRPGNGP